MATTKAISANAQKNNGSNFLHAGNVSGNNNNLSLATNTHLPHYGSKPFSSATNNIGTTTANSSGTFGVLTAGSYIMKKVTTTIAGVANTFLRSGAADGGRRRAYNISNGYRQLDHSSWDYVTGAVTKGGSEGTLIGFFDPVAAAAIAKEPFPTAAVPGELVYMVTGATPTQDDYKAKQSTDS